MKKAIFISSVFLTALLMTSCSAEPTEDITTPINNVSILENHKAIELEILELINAHRITKNLPALQLNEIIRTQTSSHTNYMIKNNIASHDYFFSRKAYLTTHAKAIEVSENVAAGYTNAQSVVNAWLNSETHKSNIEGEHTHFNITAESDKNGKWYFTNIFIKASN